MMLKKRKYPVGIQSFESIRQDGYVYVDKTPLIYRMVTEGKHYFLSRPRRFGKSLLVSTLEAVFQGRRELFEAFVTNYGIQQPQLFIATTDWEWEKYPVIRFDFSRNKKYTIDILEEQIDDTLKQYEGEYGITADSKDSSTRFQYLIKEAHRQTGRRVVVLVDEYDNFMLHSLGNRQLEEGVRATFSNLFSALKFLDDHLQFVFITGISKFSQMGIFSTLNNLQNISMLANYEAICGITEEELTTQLKPDIEQLSVTLGISPEETLAELKQMYDGYHFSKGMTDIYNPFSLVGAFSGGDILNYWFDSATPGALIDVLRKMPPLELTDIDGKCHPASGFDLPFDNYQATLPILYQSGYLTIKDYVPNRRMYTLGFPNLEVRMGFADCLYQVVSNTRPDSNSRSALLNAYYDFRDYDDLPAFIEAVKTFYASLPYQWECDNKNEHYYHALLYTLLTAFGADVRAEEPTAKGRSDLVLLMPKGIYIMELKYDDTALNALEQIDEKGYARKYLADGRPVTKVGLAFSSEERNITEYLWEAV